MADGSPHTDTSTVMDPHDRIQNYHMDPSNPFMASVSGDRQKEKFLEQKTLRRLTHNREAARKSQLRKKHFLGTTTSKVKRYKTSLAQKAGVGLRCLLYLMVHIFQHFLGTSTSKVKRYKTSLAQKAGVRLRCLLYL